MKWAPSVGAESLCSAEREEETAGENLEGKGAAACVDGDELPLRGKSWRRGCLVWPVSLLAETGVGGEMMGK